MGMKLLYGVPVYMMDRKRSVGEAVVIDGEKIKFVGALQEASNLYPDTEKTELQKGCILPGFIDAHLHLKNFSLLFKDLDLTVVRGSTDLIQKLSEVVSSKKESEWIIGGGVNFRLLGGVTKNELDTVAPQNPLILYSRDMHSVIINSAALRVAGIDEGRSDPLGGAIERDRNGMLTGILKERAIELVKRVIPEEKSKTVLTAIESGMELLLSEGITSFCDCSIYETESLMHTLLKLCNQGKMHTRAVLMFGDREASRLGSLGIQSLFGNEKVKIGGCKVILDGSLSSLTGYMSQPYRGTESHGMLLMNENELYQILKRSYSDYLWAGVHAIGDRANEIALTVFEKLNLEVGIPRLLKRIEHAQTLQDEVIDRFPSSGIIPVMNPVHIPFDRDTALKYLGPDARLQHRLGSLLSAGAMLAIGSDAPVGSVNPFDGIYSAVERKDFMDGPELRFFSKESISLIDAVYAYTMGSACALGLEKVIGSIEEGKYADFIQLSIDIFNHSIETIREGEVLKTFVSGELVYEKRKSN